MSLDINLTNIQSIPIVVNANITAENNKVYHVIANATFTDPTPVEGRGYFVVVRNASSCALGGNSYIAGETIHRIFHSGSWLNIALRPSTYVPISRTINGLDLSANRTLTTANINDSTNKRYVTDAQLTVLGNTSGTNTGDQNLSGLVPYTGATADVDLGNNDLNAEGIKIKGTAGNGHLNLKHQSSASTAGGSESVLYADNTGNPKWKNDGNAVQAVMLENSAITGATKTKITYDSKGLVTAGSDATTADIADSTNKRYVTDAQLTVLGNTSGTNTGDQTLSGLGGVPTTRTITINGTTQDLSADRSYTVGNPFPLFGAAMGTVLGASTPTTRFFAFLSLASVAAENQRQIPVPYNVTFKNFFCFFGVGAGQPTTGSLVLTIRKNGVDTAITITIPAGSSIGTYSDTTNSESFAAGDLISVKAVNNALLTSGNITSLTLGTI